MGGYDWGYGDSDDAVSGVCLSKRLTKLQLRNSRSVIALEVLIDTQILWTISLIDCGP